MRETGTCHDVEQRIRVGAVDDHPVMLTGIRTELADSAPDLVFGDTAATVDDLLAGGERYDVVLLDLRLGDGSRPLDNVARLRGAGAVAIVYTDGLDNASAREALAAGAMGIVLKDEPSRALADAVRTGARGDTVVGGRLAAVLESAPHLPAALSDREAEALRLYASNMPAKSVARRMGVSEGTAKEYLKRVRAKYAALNRPSGTKLDLYHRAVEDGVIGPAPGGEQGPRGEQDPPGEEGEHGGTTR